jgi:hypothetical protein
MLIFPREVGAQCERIEEALLVQRENLSLSNLQILNAVVRQDCRSAA